MYDDIIQRKRWNPGIIYTPYIPLQMKTTLSKNGITVYIDTVTGISGTSIPMNKWNKYSNWYKRNASK